jgi:hypothetical protein
MNEAGGTFIKKIKSRAHFFYDRFSKKTLAKWLNFENSDGLQTCCFTAILQRFYFYYMVCVSRMTLFKK